MTRFLVFWLMFVVMVAMIVVAALGTLVFHLTPSESIFRLLGEIRMRPWVLWFPLTPVVFFTSVLVRLRLALVARLEDIANAASEDATSRLHAPDTIEPAPEQESAAAPAAAGDTPLVIEETGLAEG
jgi:hypothetical protein